jgi:hypothetical protein
VLYFDFIVGGGLEEIRRREAGKETAMIGGEAGR